MGAITNIRVGVTVAALVAATVVGGGTATPAAVAAEPGSFSTSFEAGQPQPSASTVEVGPNGPRQSQVSGTASTDGSVLGQVVAVTASAQNLPGEAAANLADANPDTKWLAFASTGWVRYQLAKPATVVRWS